MHYNVTTSTYDQQLCFQIGHVEVFALRLKSQVNSAWPSLQGKRSEQQ